VGRSTRLHCSTKMEEFLTGPASSASGSTIGVLKTILVHRISFGSTCTRGLGDRACSTCGRHHAASSLRWRAFASEIHTAGDGLCPRLSDARPVRSDWLAWAIKGRRSPFGIDLHCGHSHAGECDSIWPR